MKVRCDSKDCVWNDTYGKCTADSIELDEDHCCLYYEEPEPLEDNPGYRFRDWLVESDE